MLKLICDVRYSRAGCLMNGAPAVIRPIGTAPTGFVCCCSTHVSNASGLSAYAEQSLPGSSSTTLPPTGGRCRTCENVNEACQPLVCGRAYCWFRTADPAIGVEVSREVIASS